MQCIYLIILDMASSSTNLSNVQNTQSNQSSETSDTSKKVVSTSTTYVVETIHERGITLTKHKRTGIYY